MGWLSSADAVAIRSELAALRTTVFVMRSLVDVIAKMRSVGDDPFWTDDQQRAWDAAYATCYPTKPPGPVDVPRPPGDRNDVA